MRPALNKAKRRLKETWAVAPVYIKSETQIGGQRLQAAAGGAVEGKALIDGGVDQYPAPLQR